MKIVQVNCVYGVGSTGKITQDIHKGLIKNGYESVVLYGRGKKTNEENVLKVCSEIYAKTNNLISRFTGLIYGGCLLSTRKLIKTIKKQQPDIVHLQCINGFFCNIFSLLEFLKYSNISTVITLHAEFMYTANCSHAGGCNKWIDGCHNCQLKKSELKSVFFDRTSYAWSRMRDIYNGWDDLSVVACSRWIASRAKASGTMKNADISVIHNGIENNKVFLPVKVNRNKFNKLKYIEDKKIILYVSPFFNEAKGFHLFLEIVKKCKDKPYHFVAIGDLYEHNLNNLTVVGKVSNQNELAEYYSLADVLLICSKNENYPTVSIEASSCGTPIVSFDVGGVKETITEGMGTVVSFGDTDDMIEKFEHYLDNPPSKKTIDISRLHHSEKRMIGEYISLYEKMIN